MIMVESNSDEIEISEVYKFFIDSKKIIISTFVIFSLLIGSFFYFKEAQYQSIALIEIGKFHQYSLLADTGKKIESLVDLRGALKKHFIYGNLAQDKIKFSILGREDLLEIRTTSNSEEKNIKLIGEVFDFIKKRHHKIKIDTINRYQNSINYLDKEINKYKKKLVDKKEFEFTLLYESILQELNENKNRLSIELNTYTEAHGESNQVYFETTNNDENLTFILILSISMGFALSLLSVLLVNFFTNTKIRVP